jgi:hypothetical protein
VCFVSETSGHQEMVSEMRIKRFFVRLAGALAASLLLATPASALGVCGVTGSATAAAATYDPFNPSGLGTTTVTLNMTRVNPPGGGKTSTVNFYLKAQNNTADNTTITPTAAVGSVTAVGLGLQIFYNFSTAGPNLAGAPSAANRFLQLNFTGNNAASDTVQVTFTVMLPANLDLTATQNLAFDVIYACNGNGGGGPFTDSGTITNAMSFPITVLSALQASYVGSALAFGEVGDKTTAQVLAASATYSTPNTNHLFVRSSGPYQVAVASANGYKLRFTGSTGANQELNYKADFLGQILTSATPTFTTTTCDRASLAGENLPIRATLLEGGQGKTSSAYSDTITVTVSPLVTAAAPVNCDAFVLPAP